MNPNRNTCLAKTQACTQPIRWQLAMAFLIGMLAQHALVSRCLAIDEADRSGKSQLTAAMPEAGSPPTPVTASQAKADEPTADEPAASKPELAAAETTSEPANANAAPAIAGEPSEEAKEEAKEPQQESTQPAVTSTEVEVRELSVSPEHQPLLPAGRPAWVGAPPDLSNPRRHRLFVGSFPTSSVDETDAALDEPMLAAVNGYIDEEVLDSGDAAELHITTDFIRRNLLESSTEYVATLSTSSGPMYQKWIVLEITPEHRKHFVEAYRQVQQKKRMVALGLGLASVMSLTGVAHLAFNRRRRRYAQTAQPVVHAVFAEPEPVASKPNNRPLYLLAGSLGGLVLLGVLMLGSMTVAYRARSVHRMNTYPMHTLPGEEVIITGQPPMPPEPPRAPMPHFESAEMQSMLETHREKLDHMQNAWQSAERHRQIIELRSDRD